MKTAQELTGHDRVIAAFKKQAAIPTPSGTSASKTLCSPALEKIAAAFRREAGATAPLRRVEPAVDPSKLTGLARTAAAFKREFEAKFGRTEGPAPSRHDTPRERVAAAFAQQVEPRSVSKPAAKPSSVVNPTFAGSAASPSKGVLTEQWFQVKACANTSWTSDKIRGLIRSKDPMDHIAAHDAIQEVGPKFPGVWALINELFDAQTASIARTA